MFIKANKRCQLLLEFSMIVLGTLIMGFSFSVFLEPNNISTGGFSALSMIMNAILFKIGIKFIPTSVIYLILNIGLYFLALHALGKRFAINHGNRRWACGSFWWLYRWNWYDCLHSKKEKTNSNFWFTHHYYWYVHNHSFTICFL